MPSETAITHTNHSPALSHRLVFSNCLYLEDRSAAVWWSIVRALGRDTSSLMTGGGDADREEPQHQQTSADRPAQAALTALVHYRAGRRGGRRHDSIRWAAGTAVTSDRIAGVS